MNCASEVQANEEIPGIQWTCCRSSSLVEAFTPVVTPPDDDGWHIVTGAATHPQGQPVQSWPTKARNA